MLEERPFRCPYCGERVSCLLDGSAGAQDYVEDCEVCCRPFEVFAECEPGEVISVDVLGN